TAAYDPGASQPPAPPGIGQAVFLDGRPFPERPVFSSALAPAARTLHVSRQAPPAGGDGSRERPWNDLQAAVRSLSPGDRLLVGPGEYRGPLRIDASCRNGMPQAPIQVVFEKATFAGSGSEPVVTAGRAFWRFEGFSAGLEEGPEPAFAVEGPDARGIVFDRARISGGAGPGARIGAGASDVVLANSSFSRSGRGVSPVGAIGISIEPGSTGVRVVGNRVFDRPSGAVRIGPPIAVSGTGPPPRDIVVEGNTFVGSRSPAVLVTAGEGLRISGNTILSTEWAGGLEGRGIVIEGGTGVRIEGNHVVDAPVSVQVGWVEPDGPGQSQPADVLVARNYFERRGAPDPSGVDVEAGDNVRIANNVFDGVFDGVLLFGGPPRTRHVVIANNLLLGVSRLAFRVDDLSCASLFDGNLFSPRTSSVPIEIGGEIRDLRRYLFDGHMRRSRLVPGVRILHKDLGRVDGVEIRDSGIPVEGVRFEGRAPDLGLSEH
ncbi:MAG: right-handed parallel beta-helix repeat-containing protein, partial [Acidobacteriota bacterium]